MDFIILPVTTTLEAFGLPQHLLLILKTGGDFMMDRTVLVITSFLLGMVVLLAAELILFWKHFSVAPTLPPPRFEETQTQLPEALKSRLEHSSLKKKEECIWLNFLMQFLFSELRDSMQLRRFLTKKIQMEFEEVLKSRSGILVDELFLRDFHLGDSFPVIMGMSVEKSEVSNGVIQTLNLKTRVAYDGGFQIAIDAALPFHRMAFVSVTILKLRGVLRFQFTQIPFSHWNMSFYEEPELEVDVVAQLDGRPMPKLKNIIANQIRKIIRKKHTLPMYKMRFKPFFLPHLDAGQPTDVHINLDGAELGYGVLEVTIIEANQLPFVIKGAQVYCTVSVDELPWKEQRMKERSNRKVMTFELVKIASDQSLGMTVKDELLPDRLHAVVVIGEVSVGSPAHMANILQGDILLGVGGSKVTSAKQAMKNLKWAKDRIQVQIERVGSEMNPSTSSKDDSLLFPRKTSSWHDGQTTEKAGNSDTDSAHNLSNPVSSSSESPKAKSNIRPEGRKTVYTEASVNPKWNQKFIFSVQAKHNFLNVCLWSKGGDRSSKTDMSTSAKQDVILGYVNLSLEEIYLHCLVTLNGSLQDKVKLKHGHFKTEDELVKAWSVHKGFDLNHMYGNISLGFHYIPTSMSQDQRRDASNKLPYQLKERYQTREEDEQQKPSPTRIAEDLRTRDLNEVHHQFGSTTFTTAIFCDYCGKKIWMKEAFKCQTCNMVCHKKCLVKCLVNTVCTESGAKRRGAINKAWEPLASTGKLKPSSVVEDNARNLLFQEEDILDCLTADDANMNTSDSMHSLTNFFDVITIETDPKVLPVVPKENLQEVNSLTRFRGLKEQTDRMKDSVLKHLRRNKVPAAFNDKAIMAAKEAGARLFSDMDPSLRKDKLEEMVKKLDQELKTEMENKESSEQELTLLEAAELKTPSSKRKSEIKSVSNKIFRSSEKQDALRLLMLEYCSGLQNCINFLEAEANSISNRPELIDVPLTTTQQEYEQPKVSRSAAVGGFVRRASSSVKEKMSFIKKDFGKKGARIEEDDKTASLRNIDYDKMVIIKSFEEEKLSAASSKTGKNDKIPSIETGGASTSISVNDDIDKTQSLTTGEDDKSALSFNNKHIDGESTIEERDRELLQDSSEGVHLHRQKPAKSINTVRDTASIPEIEEVSEIAEMATQISDTVLKITHSPIEIYVDEVDIPSSHDAVNVQDANESNFRTQEEAGIPRSSSDSRLEISKIHELRPEDILRYRGTSLPRLPVIDDSDSDSDYLVIDSSDEHVVTDSSDSNYEEGDVDFKGGDKKTGNDDSDDGRDQHRSTIQQLQTYQV